MSVRDEYLAHFRDTARAIFAKRPELRSIVLGVSQYWNDEADDAVHEWIVASERDVPLWPHVCDGGWHDEDNPIEHVAGEVCESCAGLFDEPGYLTWWHDNSTAVEAFEPYCHESGSQGRPDWYNALPAAIARKRGDDIEVELLGPVQRPHSILQAGGAAVEDPIWRDPRALELYEQVCAAPADDGPRRVLADYLLEREMPRGELIAHALAASPMYIEMLAADRERWLAPLAAIVPIDTARFDRGFLSDVELFAVDRAHRGHPALASVERLYVHAGSASILDHSMRALRELGPINRAWLEDLVAAPRPWAIETLDIDISDAGMIDLLRDTTMLPALRHLIVRGDSADEAASSLARSPWWHQLDRLTIVDPRAMALSGFGRRAELQVPWLAVRWPSSDPVRADGWEFAFGPDEVCEATLRGFTPEARREALKMHLSVMPVRTVKLVASRYYTPSAADAAFVSRDGLVVT